MATLYAVDQNASHNKFDSFRYYFADVRYRGEEYPLFLNVGHGKADGQYHLYDITKKIRDTADRINGLERPKPNEGYALENDVSNVSIPNVDQIVKAKAPNADGGNHLRFHSQYITKAGERQRKW
ncbi:MAG: hypothetical protein E7541_00195 [Ruminococcaceae bacterium]|nr:hypothetical protein [Oscillospiraceae bacterium]